MINLPSPAQLQPMGGSNVMQGHVVPANQMATMPQAGLSTLGNFADLIAAMKKSKTNNLLAGQLPGVDPANKAATLANALNQGPPTPLSLGGTAPQ